MTAYAITESGNHIDLHRVRHDRRGMPRASFDWLTGERVISYGDDTTPDATPDAPTYISPISAQQTYAPHAGHCDEDAPDAYAKPAINLPRALPMGYARRLIDGRWQDVPVI